MVVEEGHARLERPWPSVSVTSRRKKSERE